MIARYKLSVREATPDDRHKIANLIHFEVYVHRHLDWRPPLDWLGYQPYLIAEQNNQVSTVLACPPDPPGVAWIRLFAVSSGMSIEKAWHSIWPAAREKLLEQPDQPMAAAIPLQRWFEDLLISGGFEQTHRVVMLSWSPGQNLQEPHLPDILIRPMNFDDLDVVEQLDNTAFGRVWQTSQSGLELAFRQSAVATLAEYEGTAVGYQISTVTPMGGHLARLAVHPDYQGKGIGYGLVWDMLYQFERRGAQMVTVNTQQDNLASLALYEKAGFRRTGEEYPVYQFDPSIGYTE